MLFLKFQPDKDCYAIDVRQVVEVLPPVALKHVPDAPAGVAGIVNYRGTPVPVVDSSELLLGRRAREGMSTRIVIVNYPAENGEMKHLLGLIVEKATGTVRRAPEDFSDTGIDNPETPYLGPVAADAGGLMQWIDVGRLLPDAVRDVLFKKTQGSH